jgi:3-hydroxybutyryl-CoA dehydratase
MMEYRWDDLYIGLRHEFDATFSANQANAFASLSGDVNPLHVDEAYAKDAGYPGPVLFGMLTSALYSRLVGVYLPGKFALLQGIRIDFSSPCYAGDCLHVAGEVVFLSEAYRRLEIKATIRNGDGKLVSKALIKAGFHGD